MECVLKENASILSLSFFYRDPPCVLNPILIAIELGFDRLRASVFFSVQEKKGAKRIEKGRVIQKMKAR